MIKHYFSDGVYAKQMHIDAGQYIVSHKHKYSHMSILASGEVVVRIEGEEIRYEAPACIEIGADQHHMITAIKDSVWFCIHATAETDVERIDETLISNPDMKAVAQLVIGGK
ncbi:cupin domain-containing protein [Nitrosospira sp. Nsp1]|uniref:cupin domain-containing protein n=1 Tax=Nitrosospira sp. Nsp1 TaxID=136547 RepID=UPI000889140D|nr:cupin domain-containing protein [Nitrosospira sp. Nsp1]SCX58902.1 hypothetical protein SAMN05720354_12220 [Nitrosospira sp. Nsp1]